MAQNLHVHKNDTAFVVSGEIPKKTGQSVESVSRFPAGDYRERQYY